MSESADSSPVESSSSSAAKIDKSPSKPKVSETLVFNSDASGSDSEEDHTAPPRPGSVVALQREKNAKKSAPKKASKPRLSTKKVDTESEADSSSPRKKRDSHANEQESSNSNGRKKVVEIESSEEDTKSSKTYNGSNTSPATGSSILKSSPKKKAKQIIESDDEEVLEYGFVEMGDENNEEEEEEEEDSVYTVEKIVDARISSGRRQYFIKWHGYPDSDNTWEDEANVFSEELIKEFWDSRKSSASTKKRTSTSSSTPAKKARSDNATSSKSANTKKSSTVSTSPKKRPAQTQKVPTDEEASDEDIYLGEVPEEYLELESWEDKVKLIGGVDKLADGTVVALLDWVDGKQYAVNRDVANQKCPQKMIHFYQERMTFIRK